MDGTDFSLLELLLDFLGVLQVHSAESAESTTPYLRAVLLRDSGMSP